MLEEFHCANKQQSWNGQNRLQVTVTDGQTDVRTDVRTDGQRDVSVEILF